MERDCFCSQAEKPAEKPGEGKGFTPLEVRLPPPCFLACTCGSAGTGAKARMGAGSERRHRDSAGLVLTGFTIVELLVVLGIIAVLMGILLPVLVRIRCEGRTMTGMCNQRQIVNAVNFFAVDNDGRYPESVATIGFGTNWSWQEPTMLTAYMNLSPGLHRSMSAYLRRYIKDASVMFCPNAPRRYKYLQQSWDAGDDWDNPETGPIPDPVKGTYCFYWNYTGLLAEDGRLFKGPCGPSWRRGQSKLLVTDYFGYDHWRSPNGYGSCEGFGGADITVGTCVSSAYWSRTKSDSFDLSTIDIRLHAGYTDGHVESFTASEVATMKVIKDPVTNEPYGYGPGDFYLPRNGLR